MFHYFQDRKLTAAFVVLVLSASAMQGQDNATEIIGYQTRGLFDIPEGETATLKNPGSVALPEFVYPVGTILNLTVTEVLSDDASGETFSISGQIVGQIDNATYFVIDQYDTCMMQLTDMFYGCDANNTSQTGAGLNATDQAFWDWHASISLNTTNSVELISTMSQEKRLIISPVLALFPTEGTQQFLDTLAGDVDADDRDLQTALRNWDQTRQLLGLDK